MEKRPGLRSGVGSNGSLIVKGRTFDDVDPSIILNTSSIIKQSSNITYIYSSSPTITIQVVATIKKKFKCRVRNIIYLTSIVVQVQGHWTVNQLIKKLLQKQRKRNKPCRVRYRKCYNNYKKLNYCYCRNYDCYSVTSSGVRSRWRWCLGLKPPSLLKWHK